MRFNAKQIGAVFWMPAIVLFLVYGGWRDIALGVAKGDLRRINDTGPVEITVVFLNPLQKGTAPILSFEVRMNTHSVNLEAYDMAKVSFLRIDGGAEQETLGWFDPGGGGHHIYGVLKFPGPIPSQAKSIRLIIR